MRMLIYIVKLISCKERLERLCGVSKKLIMQGLFFVTALILVVDGFLYYRYQQKLSSVEDDRAARSTAEIPTTAVEETTATAATTASENAMKRTDEAAVFTHLSTSETIVNNSTYVDHPLANGNPDAILLAERSLGPGGDSADFHYIGVWYDANRSTWAVFNQDRTPMSSNTAFDVSVFEEPGGDIFVHRATPANTVDNETYVDSPLTNESPDAVLSITPNWNPGGGAGTYNNHPVSVRYDAGEAKWVILNQDLGLMPEGAAFNVGVS